MKKYSSQEIGNRIAQDYLPPVALPLQLPAFLQNQTPVRLAVTPEPLPANLKPLPRNSLPLLEPTHHSRHLLSLPPYDQLPSEFLPFSASLPASRGQIPYTSKLPP